MNRRIFLVGVWLIAGAVAWPVYGADAPATTTTAPSAAGVTVVRKDVEVTYKTYDPQHMPDPAPPLSPGESAICLYRYGLATDMRYTFTKPAAAAGAGSGPVSMDFKITRMTVTLTLSVTIWLPADPPAQLRAHEEGHRAICEAFYADAERVARGLAEKEVGRVVRGTGKDVEAAGRDVIGRVTTRICDAYLAAVHKPCDEAQDIYDDATAHGRNARPTSAEAVGMAVKRVKK